MLNIFHLSLWVPPPPCSGSWDMDLCDPVSLLVLWLLLCFPGGNMGRGLMGGPEERWGLFLHLFPFRITASWLLVSVRGRGPIEWTSPPSLSVLSSNNCSPCPFRLWGCNSSPGMARSPSVLPYPLWLLCDPACTFVCSHFINLCLRFYPSLRRSSRPCWALTARNS